MWFDEYNPNAPVRRPSGLGQAGLQQGGFGQAGFPGSSGQQQAFQPGSVKALRARREQEQQQQQPQAPKKNFFQDNISTAGGIGGALAGAAGGAAIGSVVPGLGTIIGGLIGSVVGGAGGSGAGQLAENAVVGEKDLGKDVLQEALLGGLFSAPPIRGAKAAFGAGKALAGGAGAQAAKQAAETALTRPGVLSRTLTGVAGDTGKTGVAGRIAESGNKALAGQYGVLRSNEIRQLDPADTIRKLTDLGLVKPQDVERVALGITGSNGILTNAVNKSVGASGTKLDVSAVRRVFDDALETVGIVDKDRRSLEAVFNAQVNRLRGGANVSLNKVDPTDALAVMKSFEKRIADLSGKGGNFRMATPERLDQAAALRLVRDEIEDQLYIAGGANANVARFLNGDVRDQLIKLAPNNKQWGSYVDNTIMQSRSVGELRSAQAPFVKAQQIIRAGEDNAFSAGSQLANSLGGIQQTILNRGLEVARGPASRLYAQATRDAAGAAGRLGGALAPDAGRAAGLGLIPQSARQVIGGSVADAVMGQPQPLEDTLMQNQQFGGQQFGGQDPNQLGGIQGQFGGQGGFDQMGAQQSQNPYPQANLLFDLQRDPANAAAYIQQFQQLQEIFAPAASSQKLNATQLQQANNADSALVDIQAITQAIESDPSIIAKNELSTGPITRGITGTTNYQAAKQNISDVLARLRSGAAISETELKLYGSLLPELGNSPEDALGKLRRLQTLLQSFATPQPAQADLTSTLIDRGAF